MAGNSGMHPSDVKSVTDALEVSPSRKQPNSKVYKNSTSIGGGGGETLKEKAVPKEKKL